MTATMISLDESAANHVCAVVMQALTCARQGGWEAAVERLRMALNILTGEECSTEGLMKEAERDSYVLMLLTAEDVIRIGKASRAIQAMAGWCGMSVAEFVGGAISDHMAEVQAVMDEEKTGELR